MLQPTVAHSYVNCLKLFGRKYELQSFPLRSDYLRGWETCSLLGPLERANTNYWVHQTHRHNSLESNGQCTYKFVLFEVHAASRVGLVKTDVSEERVTSIFRAEKITRTRKVLDGC
jgi:hypothetical protein